MNGERDPRERGRALMMAALDDELSGAEREEFERLIARDAALREEWKAMHRVKEVTGTMGYQRPPEEIWDGYWTSVYNRLERGVGWLLFSAGTAVLAAFGIWKWVEALFRESDVPVFVRVAVAAMLIGLAVLLISVVREKLFTARRDPYKEVQR